jgi:hypothetical protein
MQEARRAVEKAYDVPRVDDKVNKAVAAANKAANAARVSAVKAAQKRIPNNGDLPLSVVWIWRQHKVGGELLRDVITSPFARQKAGFLIGRPVSW